MSVSTAKRYAFDCHPDRFCVLFLSYTRSSRSRASFKRPRRNRLIPRVPSTKICASLSVAARARRWPSARSARSRRALGPAGAREVARLQADGPHHLEAVARAQRLEEVARLHAGAEDDVDERRSPARPSGARRSGRGPRARRPRRIRSLKRKPDDDAGAGGTTRSQNEGAQRGRARRAHPDRARTPRRTATPSSMRPDASSCSAAARSSSTRSSGGAPARPPRGRRCAASAPRPDHSSDLGQRAARTRAHSSGDAAGSVSSASR